MHFMEICKYLEERKIKYEAYSLLDEDAAAIYIEGNDIDYIRVDPYGSYSHPNEVFVILGNVGYWKPIDEALKGLAT